MNKVKVGVVGVGRIGALLEEDRLRQKPCTHLGAYMAVPECEVVAIADEDVDKAYLVAKKWGISNVFKSGKEMTQKCPIDLVSISTPTENHFNVAMDVAPHVKAIFCEKPITDDVKTAKTLVGACKDMGVILAVNHTRRWHPLFQSVKKRIDKGEIGRLLGATGYFSGDTLNDGVHMFDLFNWFNPPSYMCIPCETDYLLFEFDLIGTEGRIRISENGRKIERYNVVESDHYEGYKELSSGLVSDPFKHSNPMINAVKDLVFCLQKGYQPKCTGEDGLKALELALALYPKGG